MAGQVFIIGLRLETECEEKVDEKEVLDWLKEQFEGCGMGEVSAFNVVERGPYGEAAWRFEAGAFEGWALAMMRNGPKEGDPK
jgi:hypothetical protein